MKMDYKVFEPEDERLARIFVRFLQERGYNAGYQLGYPNNKLFIRVNTKEEANRISSKIREFMEKFSQIGSEITFDELSRSISIPNSVLTEAENASNLATRPEPEIEETESEEPEQEELELEPEEPEPEPIFEELEPEEPEPEPISGLEPEPEQPEEPELEPILELEPEPEQPEPEPIFEEPEPEKPEEPEPQQKKKKTVEEPFSFNTF